MPTTTFKYPINCNKLKNCVHDIQWNLKLSFLDVSFPQIHHSVSVVPEQIISKLQPPQTHSFPVSAFFFGTPNENDESRFHCNVKNILQLNIYLYMCRL
jgi:hypothetical protein